MPGFPIWTRTLGAMIDSDSPVRVICSACGECGEVDLVALADRVGRDYSLINRRCRCRLTPHCPGWNRFYYLAAVFRPLWTIERVDEWSRIDRAERGIALPPRRVP